MNSIVFYNKRGNEKLVIVFNVNGCKYSMSKLTNFINAVCAKNDYTFAYKDYDKELYRNIPKIDMYLIAPVK